MWRHQRAQLHEPARQKARLPLNPEDPGLCQCGLEVPRHEKHFAGHLNSQHHQQWEKRRRRAHAAPGGADPGPAHAHEPAALAGLADQFGANDLAEPIPMDVDENKECGGADVEATYDEDGEAIAAALGVEFDRARGRARSPDAAQDADAEAVVVPFEAIEHPEEEAQVEPQVPPQPVAVVVGSVPKTKRSHVCSTTASLGYPQHACCVVDLILTLWFWSTYPKFRNPLRSSLMHDTTVFPNATCIRSLDALARWPDTLPAAPDEIVELKTAAGGELVHRSVKGVLRHLVDDPLLVAHLATRPDMLDYTDGSALARAAEAGFRMATFWWTDELCHCICVPFSAATGGFLWAGDVVIVRKHKHRAGDVAGRVIRFATRHGEDMLEVAVGDEAGETAWYRLSRVLQAYSILNPPPAGVHAPQPTLHERRRKAHGHPAVTLPLQMSSDDVRVPCSGALMLVLRLLMGAQATMNKSKRFNHNETIYLSLVGLEDAVRQRTANVGTVAVVPVGPTVTLADLLTSVLTETNELQEEGMLAYYAPWKCAVRLFPRVVSFAVDGPRANELTTTKIHACRFCFNDRLARQPKTIVGRRTLAGMEKLESIRQKKDAELVRARGLAGPLVRSVRRSAAAVALGLDITLEDARILKGQIDALVRDACKASGIAMRAVAVALEQVAPIAEEVADAMEEDEQH